MRARRLPVADWPERDGEWLVLVDDRAVRVTGLAPEILRLTEHWRSVGDLTRRLEKAFGRPPGGSAEALVRAALDDLAAEQLLELSAD
jgi:hypothetical protein